MTFTSESRLGRLRAAAGVVILMSSVTTCGGDQLSRSPAAVADLGVIPLDGLAWPEDGRIVSARDILGSDPSRFELVGVDVVTHEVLPIPVPVPSECPSIDAHIPMIVNGLLVVDRYCYPGPLTPIAGYHELIGVRLDGSAPEALARLPWFPDSFVRLDSGAWLSGFDSGICAWIDVVPDTGQPDLPWPIVVDDDGEPFAVNAARGTDCDRTPLASGIARAADGALAFVASGAARRSAGFARLDMPQNLYLREPDGTVRRLAGGLVHPTALAFNPQGDALGVAASVNGRTGVWRFDRTGQRSLLYEGRANYFAWSPDGGRIAVLRREGDPTDPQAPIRLLIVTPG